LTKNVLTKIIRGDEMRMQVKTTRQVTCWGIERDGEKKKKKKNTGEREKNADAHLCPEVWPRREGPDNMLWKGLTCGAGERKRKLGDKWETRRIKINKRCKRVTDTGGKEKKVYKSRLEKRG